MDSSILTSNYVIVRHIFSFLGWKDLKKVKRVCKLWKLVAENVKRFTPAQVFYIKKFQFNRQHLRNAFNMVVDRKEVYEPLLCLCFNHPKLMEISYTCEKLPTPLCKDPKKCKIQHKVFDYARTRIYQPREMISIFTHRTSFQSLVVKTSKFCLFSLSGFTLPKINGVKVEDHYFCMDANRCGPGKQKAITSEYIRLMEGKLIKCILIFINDKKFEKQFSVPLFIDDVYASQEDSVPFAVAGSLIQGSKSEAIHPINPDKAMITLITFYVEKDRRNVQFEPYSFIFNQEWYIPMINGSLKKDFSTLPRREHTIALIISTEKHYFTSLIEQILLVNMFPRISMIGSTGAHKHIIGTDMLNQFPIVDEPHVKRRKTGLNCISKSNEPLSVIVLLSWGPKLPNFEE